MKKPSKKALKEITSLTEDAMGSLSKADEFYGSLVEAWDQYVEAACVAADDIEALEQALEGIPGVTAFPETIGTQLPVFLFPRTILPRLVAELSLAV